MGVAKRAWWLAKNDKEARWMMVKIVACVLVLLGMNLYVLLK